MVRERLEPSREVRLLYKRDSNCRPRSVTMVDGTPNREIQPLRNAMHGFGPSSKSINAVCVSMGWREWSNQYDIKTVVRCRLSGVV